MGVSYVLFPVTREALHPPLFAAQPEVDAAVDGLYTAIQTYEDDLQRGCGEPGSAVDDGLRRLGELLPLGTLIRELAPRRLFVAPDGALARLPFQALRDPESDIHLIDLVPAGIELWPCAAHLLGAPERRAIRRVLLVCPEESDLFSSLDERERVSGLIEELEIVRSGAEILQRLRSEEEIDLLYFIGHGGLRKPGDTLSTFLQMEDRPLRAADFFRRSFSLRPGAIGLFNCCLVGSTDGGMGKELTGLVRGLFYAGLSTIVAPLWSVEDETAAEIMPAVCASLASGVPLGSALREAVRHIRHDFHHSELGREVAHPYFWASYQPWGR